MNQTNQLLLKLLIGIVILAGVGAAIMIMTSNNVSSGGNKLLTIAFSFLFYGITGSICWAITRKREHNLLGNSGIIISAVAFLFQTILIVGEVDSTDMLKLAFSLFIVSIALAHICFLFYITVQNRYASMARVLATLFISIFSLLIITKVFDIDSFSFMRGPGETYIRFVFATLVLDLAATLLVPLCNRLLDTTSYELMSTSELPVATNDVQQP
jgi:hypothetical protein